MVDYYFKNSNYVYFALTVPFSYYDQVSYLEDLDEKIKTISTVYYHREVLVQSHMGFDVFVLHISQI